MITTITITITTDESKTYWKFPLGLPQCLDAVVMRHPCLERLGAHDPMPTLTVVVLRTHDDNDDEGKNEKTKKNQKKPDDATPGLDA